MSFEPSGHTAHLLALRLCRGELSLSALRSQAKPVQLSATDNSRASAAISEMRLAIKKRDIERGLAADCDLWTILNQGLEAQLTHKLFHFLALEVHAATVRGDSRPEVVHVEGGLVGLATAIGSKHEDMPAILRRILDLGRRIEVAWHGYKVGGLWFYNIIDNLLEIHLSRAVFLADCGETAQ